MYMLKEGYYHILNLLLELDLYNYMKWHWFIMLVYIIVFYFVMGFDCYYRFLLLKYHMFKELISTYQINNKLIGDISLYSYQQPGSLCYMFIHEH